MTTETPKNFSFLAKGNNNKKKKKMNRKLI